VTLKHWDAYSLEDSDGFTRHDFNAVISNYTLHDTYFPAFKASVVSGKAKGIMCSYNAVNGIPTCAHPYLTSILDSWNYTGYITSDTDAIMDIWKTHKFTKTEEEAACKAIVDGRCDINSGTVYHTSLLLGVSKGLCTMRDVDRALAKTLKLRFELGLFDPIEEQPYWHVPPESIGTLQAQVVFLKEWKRGSRKETEGME
jgi:beta-glucosidase-like glycosyl hydrolase